MTPPEPIKLYKERENFFVPYFEIKLHGAPMPRNVVRDVIEVNYEDSIDKIDSFTLTVNNWDADRRAPKYIGLEKEPKPGTETAKLAAMFEPGNELELHMGYQGNLSLVMTGFITTVEPEFSELGAQKFLVRGLNILDKFRQKQYTWQWPEAGEAATRDSDIARSLSRKADDKAGRPGLDIEVRIDKEAASKEPREQYVLMKNQYPIVFLMERARRRGYSLFVGEEIKNKRLHRYLYFGPSQRLRDITYQLEWGKSLISFRPTLTTTNQVYKVTVFGWDRRNKKRIEETATLDDPGVRVNRDIHAVARAANREEVITDRPVHTLEEAKALALDVLQNQLKEMVEAQGATVGLPDLRAGRIVVIRGVGYRFNGRYFITESKHTLNDGGYRTVFKARREQIEEKA